VKWVFEGVDIFSRDFNLKKRKNKPPFYSIIQLVGVVFSCNFAA
jgi:hypothetical protein